MVNADRSYNDKYGRWNSIFIKANNKTVMIITLYYLPVINSEGNQTVKA